MVEFLDQLLDLLLAGVPGAVAGAIAANVAHPKEFVDQIKASRRRQIAETLRKRGYTGDRLLRVASRYPEWDPEHLQRLFEFTSAEAIRVLVNAGYEAGTDGFWRKSPSADGRPDLHEHPSLNGSDDDRTHQQRTRRPGGRNFTNATPDGRRSSRFPSPKFKSDGRTLVRDEWSRDPGCPMSVAMKKSPRVDRRSQPKGGQIRSAAEGTLSA